MRNVTIYDTISNNIKKYRKLRGITQAELAERVDLSHEFIRRIESNKGKKNFSIDTIYRISVALDVDVDQFFKKK
mgnify:CR=1 FL=1